MKIQSSFCFLQEIISDLKSNDKYITTFNRVFWTLGFSMPFCRPIYRLSSAFVVQWKAEVNGIPKQNVVRHIGKSVFIAENSGLCNRAIEFSDLRLRFTWIFS